MCLVKSETLANALLHPSYVHWWVLACCNAGSRFLLGPARGTTLDVAGVGVGVGVVAAALAV